MKNTYIHWGLRLVPAVILLQTLFFKFTAAPESVAIFTQMGAEPHGRIISGVLELIIAALLLMRFYVLGAVLGVGVMTGAIFSHIFVLGISVQDDGGLLFGLALLTWLCCGILVVLGRKQLFIFFPKS